jgi:hypothetical protein
MVTGGFPRSSIGSATDAFPQIAGAKIQQQRTSQNGTVASVNYATINGTKAVHKGFGPGIVGGPAANMAKIDGTNIRPKH